MRNAIRSWWLSVSAEAAAVAVLVVGSAALPGAQGIQVTPRQQQAEPGWTLTPMFVFSQSTDSNVTLAGEGTPRLADKVANLAPSVDLGYLGSLTTFDAGYSGSASRYFTLDGLNAYDQRLYGDYKTQVARHAHLFVQNSTAWLPTTDTIQFAGVPFARVGSRVESFDAGTSVDLAKFTGMTVGYRFERVDFDRSNPLSARLVGGYSHGAFGTVRQQVSPHFFVGGSFDYRHAIVAAGAQLFDILNVEGTAEYHVSPVFIVSGGGGLARIAGSLPAAPQQLAGARTGPAWHAGANYKFDRVLAFGTYQRSYVPSYGIGGTIQNQELDLGAGLPVAFRNRLFVGASYTWRRNEPLVLTQNVLTSTWFNAYASYGFAPWLRVQGYVSRSTQDSHLGGVLRNQFGVQVVTLAPMRFK